MSSQQEVFDIINGLYHIMDDSGIIWFYAKELCNYLEYKDEARRIVKLYIKDESQKIKFSKIKKFLGVKNTPRIIHGLELFINEDAIYELINNSNRPNAKKFTKWTRKIISQIRKGDIKIDGQDYKAPLIKNENGIPVFFDKSQCDDKESRFYDVDDEDMKLFRELSREIDYKLFIDKNVLYCYITSIRNVDGDNKIVMKAGYSKQITKRCEEHKIRFGAEFLLIAIKEVNDIDDEQRFHHHIKARYPESVYYFQVRDNSGKKKGADEFYKYSDELLLEFYNFEVSLKVSHKVVSDKDIELRRLDLECLKVHNENLKLEIELFKLKNNL